MAARKVSNSAAIAIAVALVAMLVVAAAADDCGVNSGQVMGSCLSYCKYGVGLQSCCNALKPGNGDCLCRNYWGKLQHSEYESCARDIQSKCRMKKCPNY